MRFFICSFLVLFAFSVYAQKRRNVYFLRNDGKHITPRDSADYIRVVEEPDSGSTLYNVFEYYKDDKKKFIGKSSTIDPLKFEEQCVAFYPNGKREAVINYKNGHRSGEEFDFYPNGHTYRVIVYNDDSKSNPYHDVFSIKENFDSLGTALVVDGNGIYKGYDENFKNINEQGKVKNGKRDSIWTGTSSSLIHNNLINNDKSLSDSKDTFISFIEKYNEGILMSGTAREADGKIYTYTKSRQVMPQFKGGLKGFYKYLAKNIKYPQEDKTNGTQGKVILQFIVDTTGAITDLKILRGVSATIDAEAKRILTQSPLWVPGTMFGEVARVYYTVPIAFSLAVGR